MYPDGTKVREYEDGTVKKILPNGKSEIIPPSNKKPTTNKAVSGAGSSRKGSSPGSKTANT